MEKIIEIIFWIAFAFVVFGLPFIIGWMGADGGARR